LANRPYITPQDLIPETLITYPVERDRLDIFTRFMDPEDVEPASIRNAELTTMMLQLVATGRGVASLPNWALTEYLEKNYVLAKKLGAKGQWAVLYAAIREDQQSSPYMEDFISTAKDTSFQTLSGITAVANP
jgi:LysR family transcriptional regulator for metE and metH